MWLVPLSADVVGGDGDAADPGHLDVSDLPHLQPKVLPLDGDQRAPLPGPGQGTDLHTHTHMNTHTHRSTHTHTCARAHIPTHPQAGARESHVLNVIHSVRH